MKKFKFRFSAVEKIRKIETEKQMKELGLAIRRQEKIEEELKQLERQLENEILRAREIVLRLEEDQMKDMSIRFRHSLREQIKKKKEDLLAAKQDVFRERRKLIEKSRDQKVIEKIKEKEKEKHYEELRKLEGKTMDETASNLWFYLHR